jgi:DNA polymerase-4
LSAENTFEKDLFMPQELELQLQAIYQELLRRIKKTGIRGRTVTLKIKYNDFSQQTRSKTFDRFPEDEPLWQTALELLNQENLTKPIRLLGLGVSNFSEGESQLDLPEQMPIPF